MYGLLGKTLSHSFSKQIHETVTKKPYNLFETTNLDEFFSTTTFTGINVTIPYKQAVIPYLDELSTEAAKTNAVNTIVSVRGKLIGYNTDVYGLEESLRYNNISLENESILILGNGSTSRSIKYICEKYFAKNIIVLARNPKQNEHHFHSVDNFKSTTIIFNATPVGMFPNNDQDILINLDTLPNLKSVVDVVYNPLRSRLIIESQKRNLHTVNGLFMLFFQAKKSMELFHNIQIPYNKMIKTYKNTMFKLSNLAFIGMPMSGKTFFAKVVADLYNKDFIDTDDEIENKRYMSIPDIFDHYGETAFREMETDCIKNISKQHNKAISCGGGVVISEQNIDYLRQNSVLLFIDVPLDLLKKCNPKGRPLLKNKENLEKLYNQRYHLYQQYADIIINKTSFDESITMKEIEVKIHEYFNS